MAELSYNAGINDDQLDKQLKEISSKLKTASTDWEKMLGSLNIPTVKMGGAGGGFKKTQLDAIGLKANLADLERQWAKLTAAQRQSMEGGELISKYAKLKKDAGDYAGTLNQVTKAQSGAASSSNTLSNNLKSTSTELSKQNFFARELVNTLKTFAGFYFARDAVKQLVDVTGQFELQQVSLQAILQDASAANKIFAQLQGLAVKSPFQFMELTTGAKQLAAMGTATKDLFSMTKNITDLSAGLGVEMGRLILAVGQVQAASVLRGQELRLTCPHLNYKLAA